MKKRTINNVYPIVVLLLAVAVCVIRIAELKSGFDLSGFTTSDISVVLTRIAAAVSVIAAVVLAFASKPEEFDFASGFGSGAGLIGAVASGFLLVMAGAYGIVTYGADMVKLVLAIFSLAGGASIIFAVKARGGAAAVVPVFFGCFLLLALYVENSGNAVLERYGYSVLAAAAGTATLYCAASAAYGVNKARFKLAVSGASVILSLASAATAVADKNYALALMFAGILAFSAGQCAAICFSAKKEDN